MADKPTKDLLTFALEHQCWCEESKPKACLLCHARYEINRLRTALALSVGELSTFAEYKSYSPEALMNRFLDEAENDD